MKDLDFFFIVTMRRRGGQRASLVQGQPGLFYSQKAHFHRNGCQNDLTLDGVNIAGPTPFGLDGGRFVLTTEPKIPHLR